MGCGFVVVLHPPSRCSVQPVPTCLKTRQTSSTRAVFSILQSSSFLAHRPSNVSPPAYNYPTPVRRRRPRCAVPPPGPEDSSEDVKDSPSDRNAPQTSDKKLLVVDLQEVLRGEDAASDIRAFSERVEVDRRTSQNPTYVVFISSSGYAASMQSILDGGLSHPDSLVTLNGTELYQHGYRTPDPYFASQIESGWIPKPVEWVVTKFFGEEIADASIPDDITVRINCKASTPVLDFCDRLARKLKLMGISARTVVQDQERIVHVVPAAGSPAMVVEFVQMMLNIQPSSTFVFGSDPLVNDCVQGKLNMGLCAASTEQAWDAFDGRVYVSSQHGIKALMEGVMHHAVF